MNTHTNLSLSGELGIVDAAALREQLREVLAHSTGDLTLELSGVDACDSAGVQLLLSLRRSLAARGASLYLSQAAAPVRHALATLGLQQLLDSPAGERA